MKLGCDGLRLGLVVPDFVFPVDENHRSLQGSVHNPELVHECHPHGDSNHAFNLPLVALPHCFRRLISSMEIPINVTFSILLEAIFHELLASQENIFQAFESLKTSTLERFCSTVGHFR
jgi:hypothetical protein